MANAIVSTRTQLVDLYDGWFDIQAWTNVPTYIGVEGELRSSYERFIAADPRRGLARPRAWVYAQAGSPRNAAGVFGRLLAFAQGLKKDAQWKKRFGDDELWAAFSWLRRQYRVAQTGADEVVFILGAAPVAKPGEAASRVDEGAGAQGVAAGDFSFARGRASV